MTKPEGRPQALVNRLAQATTTWLVIAMILWTGWGWDDPKGFIVEIPFVY